MTPLRNVDRELAKVAERRHEARQLFAFTEAPTDFAPLCRLTADLDRLLERRLSLAARLAPSHL